MTKFGYPGVEPSPPVEHIRRGEHHWLMKYDGDGHYFGMIVLQWAPSARRWCHSGNLGTGMYVDTHNWQYHSCCLMPEF